MKNGIIVGVMGVARDITERKQSELERQRLQEQLRQSQKMEAIGTLAGGIAHDFNNILSSALGFTELTLTDTKTNSRHAAFLEQVMIALKRAADLVDQILAFSRQTEHERKPVHLQSIVLEAIKLLRGSLPSIINIRQKIIPGCGVVLADATQIQQVIMNLCTNAYHAMREKGGTLGINLEPVTITKIEIESDMAELDLKEGRYIRLKVTDTGYGMDAETRKRIFEPYFTTKRVGEGTGLGLAMVHGIVKEHDGAMKVESRIGKGATFNIYFPVCDKEEEVVIQEKSFTRVQGKERILFVDDEKQIVDCVKIALEIFGYSIQVCTSSRKAFEIFRKNPDAFDVIITDQSMPGMTGSVLTKKIISLRPEIPVILCTGFNEMLPKEKADEIGICEYLNKPVTGRELANAIRKVMYQKSSQSEPEISPKK